MLKLATDGFDSPLFPELQREIQALPSHLANEALEAGVFLERRITEIYATAPPRDDSKFQWSTNLAKNRRAQRWWFANLNEGNISTDGRHYKRQGKPPYGVILNVDEQNGMVAFQVRMQDAKMKWVFGQLNNVDTRNPTHRQTGWNYAAPLLDIAIEETNRMMLEATLAYLDNL